MPNLPSVLGENSWLSKGFASSPEEQQSIADQLETYASAPVAGAPPPGQALPPAPQGGFAPVATPTPVAPTPAAIPMVEQTQMTRATTIDNEAAKAKADKAQAGLETAILEGAKTGAAQAAQEAAYREQGATEVARLNAQAIANEQARQKRIDDELTTYQQLGRELSQGSKVDPDRFWKERGTAARIGGAIAIALGAFGSSLTGGRNTALDIINDAITRDIDAQKNEIEVKKDKINVQGNLIAQLRAKGVEERVAESLARQRALDQTAERIAAATSKVDANGQTIASNKVMQQAQTTIAGLRLQSAQEEEKRKAIAVQNVTAKHPAYSPADLAKMDQEKLKRFVPDVNSFAPSEEIAKEAIKFNAEHRKVSAQIEKLKTMVAQYGNESLPTVAKAKMQQLRMMILTGLKDQEKLGAMSDSDRELLEQQIADPTKWFTRGSTTVKLLDDIQDTLNTARMSKFQAYGLVQ